MHDPVLVICKKTSLKTRGLKAHLQPLFLEAVMCIRKNLKNGSVFSPLTQPSIISPPCHFPQTEMRLLLLIKDTLIHFSHFPNQPAKDYDLSENVGSTNPRALQPHMLFLLLGYPSPLLGKDETKDGSPQKTWLSGNH